MEATATLTEAARTMGRVRSERKTAACRENARLALEARLRKRKEREQRAAANPGNPGNHGEDGQHGRRDED